jgi:drug/metabolite transporter (DMT)-like permease
MDRDERVGALLAAGAAVLFGTAYVATGLALHSFTPVAVALWRGLGATLVLLLVLGLRRGTTMAALRRLRRRDALRLVVLGLLAGPLFLVGMNLAVAATGATIAAFVAGLYAVLAAVMAPVLLRERLGARALAGFVVALAGTGLLAELDLTSGAAAGIAAGLAAAVIYALYLVLSRRWAAGGRLPGDLVSFSVFAMIGAVLLPFELAVDPGAILPASPTPEALLALAWLVVAPSAIANLMIQASVRRVPARRTSAFLLLNPIAAAVSAAVLLGERLSTPQVAGALLVLVGIAVSSGASVSLGRRGRLAAGPEVVGD